MPGSSFLGVLPRAGLLSSPLTTAFRATHRPEALGRLLPPEGARKKGNNEPVFISAGDKRPFDKTLALADSSALQISLDCVQEKQEQEAVVSEQPPALQTPWLWFRSCSFYPGLVVLLFVPSDKALLTPGNSILALVKMGVGPVATWRELGLASTPGCLNCNAGIKTCP